MIKEARRKRQALAEQEFNEYEEGKEAKFDDMNVNAHGKVHDPSSLNHHSPANFEFNFINISLPVPSYGSGLSNNGHYNNHHHGPHSNDYLEAKSTSTSDHHAEMVVDSTGSSSDPMSTIGYTSSNDSSHSSSNELEPMRTDQYPMAEEEANIEAFSPSSMAKKVQFTKSQRIMTHSGSLHIVPQNASDSHLASKVRNRKLSKSMDMDELEGSETKCCPRRKDGSFAMLSMWRQ